MKLKTNKTSTKDHEQKIKNKKIRTKVEILTIERIKLWF